MNKLLSWIKNNVLVTVLLVAVVYLFVKGNGYLISPFYESTRSFPGYGGAENSYNKLNQYSEMDSASSLSYDGRGPGFISPPYQPVAPQPDIQDRMVVTNANASLVVENVREAVSSVTNKTKELSGYVVNTNISEPTEGGHGYMSVRVPADKLTEMLSFLRSNSLRVVNEDVYGDDVTDQYVDVEERLAILTRNKTQIESIMERATEVDDILKVQESLFNIQTQIERLQGSLNYLENTSKTSLVNITMSTDEYALPYAPQEPWNIENVFKLAVRSLVTTFRSVASFAVWAVVYLPIIIPVVLVAYVVYRKTNKRSVPTN